MKLHFFTIKPKILALLHTYFREVPTFATYYIVLF